MPDCLFCRENIGEKVPAKWWAPQDNGDGTFTLSPACDSHVDGWWDGSDFPNGKGAPPITLIDQTKRQELADRIETGLHADIFYDAYAYGDEDASDRIDDFQLACGDAVTLLRS